MDTTDLLSTFRKENPEVAQIPESYEQAERIYRDALEAMGKSSTPKFNSKSSAEVVVSFKPSEALSTEKW